jgi:hypothetical protein
MYEKHMPKHTLPWLELCREYRSLKEVADQLFWANMTKFATRFGGSIGAELTLEEIVHAEHAQAAVDNCRDRIKTFIAANT